MDCQELEQFLYPYLDGEFELAERSEIERHLEHCSPCAERFTSEPQLQSVLPQPIQTETPPPRRPPVQPSGLGCCLRRLRSRACFGWEPAARGALCSRRQRAGAPCGSLALL